MIQAGQAYHKDLATRIREVIDQMVLTEAAPHSRHLYISNLLFALRAAEIGAPGPASFYLGQTVGIIRNQASESHWANAILDILEQAASEASSATEEVPLSSYEAMSLIITRIKTKGAYSTDIDAAIRQIGDEMLYEVLPERFIQVFSQSERTTARDLKSTQ